MSSSLQSEKTQAIFQNMERGFIIGVEHSKESSQWGIPDVYVNRLCQTRVSIVERFRPRVLIGVSEQ